MAKHGWSFSVTRPMAGVALFEIGVGDYREALFVATGEKNVAVTTFDPEDVAHGEPQVFVFAKPYGWSLDADDEDALVQVWQSIGVQR